MRIKRGNTAENSSARSIAKDVLINCYPAVNLQDDLVY
ncbi:hypothetical protein RVIR1_01550 [Candidatus Rickettsiella viridis]|uniref:Uncharacterized protein n=1 Tax=Candidatus Rickettsiella viridis TaxID=676208 RepID=A0A2Z5UUS0_9COXI|nr:hypothetical protein RVIR1_01550 [Candidatus Rickettsiella viridis]